MMSGRTVAGFTAAAAACVSLLGASCSPTADPANATGNRGGSSGSSGGTSGASSGGSGAAGGAPNTAFVHCNIASIVSNHCTLCHGGPPARYGAPFPLLSPADFQARTSSGKTIRERAIEVLQATDDTVMPPIGTPASETLAPGQRQNLLAWLKDGAPAQAQNGCRITDPEAPGAGGSAGIGGAGGEGGFGGGVGAQGGQAGVGGEGGVGGGEGGYGGVGGTNPGGAGGQGGVGGGTGGTGG